MNMKLILLIVVCIITLGCSKNKNSDSGVVGTYENIMLLPMSDTETTEFKSVLVINEKTATYNVYENGRPEAAWVAPSYTFDGRTLTFNCEECKGCKFTMVGKDIQIKNDPNGEASLFQKK